MRKEFRVSSISYRIISQLLDGYSFIYSLFIERHLPGFANMTACFDAIEIDAVGDCLTIFIPLDHDCQSALQKRYETDVVVDSIGGAALPFVDKSYRQIETQKSHGIISSSILRISAAVFLSIKPENSRHSFFILSPVV